LVFNIVDIVAINVKGQAVPVQACTGPEGSRRLSVPYLMTSQYAIRKVQANQEGLILHGTCQLVVCVNAVNILSGSVLVNARKENGLEVITEKTKYVVMSRDENAG